MIKKPTHRSAPLALDARALAATAGGDLDSEYCGTPWRHGPLGPQVQIPVQIEIDPRVIVIGSRVGMP